MTAETGTELALELQAEPRRRRRRDGSDRSTGLDALRAAACALVVVFHLRQLLGLNFGPLDTFIGGGDTGVFVFFALSGYLLYRPFLRGDVYIRDYALKRAARILPGYYIALIGLTLLTSSSLPVANPIAYLTITAPYSLPLRVFLGNSWTLAAEVVFYITLPVIAALSRGREVKVLTAWGVSAIALTLVFFTVGTTESVFAMATFPAVSYAFVPGMLLAVMEIKHPATFAQLAKWPYLVLGMTFIVLGMIFHVLPVAVAPIIGTPFVMGWVLHRPLPGARLFSFLGRASYAMYLWHKDLISAFGLFGVAIAIVASAASWAIVERPILEQAHRALRNRGRARAVVPAAEASAG
jgi:peptidoglycan/LPS O-acetylase OafA/YrhL